MFEVIAIPCVGDTVEKFRVVVSLIEPKGTSPLSPHNLFKVVDLIKFIEKGEFESRFIR